MSDAKQEGVINAGDVVIFHMISGNAVIGKFIGENEDGLILEKPLDIIPRKNAKGIIEVGFSPYLSLAQILPPLAQVLLRFEHIVLPRHAPEDMARSYLSSTSGIQIASSMPAV